MEGKSSVPSSLRTVESTALLAGEYTANSSSRWDKGSIAWKRGLMCISIHHGSTSCRPHMKDMRLGTRSWFYTEPFYSITKNRTLVQEWLQCMPQWSIGRWKLGEVSRSLGTLQERAWTRANEYLSDTTRLGDVSPWSWWSGLYLTLVILLENYQAFFCWKHWRCIALTSTNQLFKDHEGPRQFY